jgi:hypothetical protein
MDDDNFAAALVLIDGLLDRMDRESAGQLRASTELLSRLQGRAIPDDVRAQLDTLRGSLAGELHEMWNEKSALDRDLADWIARGREAHAAGHERLSADARERSDELITRISVLELACTELQSQLRSIEHLLVVRDLKLG